MCSRWWYSSPFRWPEFTLPMPISSIFRWPGINLSYFTTGWSIGSFISFRRRKKKCWFVDGPLIIEI
nr:hypothetical protein CFP56_19907 [Quercus suber]